MADVRRRQPADRPTSPHPAQRASQSPAPRLAIERLEVRRDRIVATVRVDPAHPNSTPRLARALTSVLPDLPRHACVNPEGDYFAAVMDHTSLPHVLEHVVIDLQTSAFAAADPDRVFTGVTRWTDAARGTATVEVSYHDDVTAIRAFRDAASLLNRLR
ncbi:MAG: cyanophycin synthetase family protein [Eggerthellaceae bacterium]|jgi:hypothetical protein